MHLLTAQPGGFVDDEGIVDLGQDAADIVVLSSADSTLAALSAGVEQLPSDYPSIRLANWMQLVKPAAYDLYEHKVLSHAKLIVVSLLGGAGYWTYGVERLIALTQMHAVSLMFVPGDDNFDEALCKKGNVSLKDTDIVWRYLRQGGIRNASGFLLFIAEKFFQKPYCVRPPEQIPDVLLYQPGEGQITLNQWKNCRRFQDTVLLIFYKSHLQSANLVLFDRLVDLMHQQALSPLVVAVSSLKDLRVIQQLNQWIVTTDVKLILNTTGFASRFTDESEQVSTPVDFISPFSRDVPVFQLILASSTVEDWKSQPTGLRTRDVAMHVALPEMDGRVITRPVSFKSAAQFNERSQFQVVRYQIHEERAIAVIQLAKAYLRLGKTDNADKRLALVLANYPTQDGRIGNGVGLDTPASTLTILRGMTEAGYTLGSYPDSVKSLMDDLISGVTNNTDTLDMKGCWQSISLERYWQYFNALPSDCQEAVLARWGEPSADPKYRNGRLMIAGVRYGNVFVGIQPARGFNLDLNANYHDPDLVPPHAYLAFYFWLQQDFDVQAVVHVGKHGNVEWLPGKGVGLSSGCWPDVAIGRLPHFYPFIVNDPGEGSQAKRRTQAVIIDHLMPPMSRAETYGALFELESLVDEYFQALTLDGKRQDWLQEKILEQVKSTHLLEELSPLAKDNDRVLLEELDTYLCDIKEAQIRHGLHILGSLPDRDSLLDTLIALTRLPRGDTPESRGILHNLAKDLALVHKGSAYDPFMQEVEAFESEKPVVLLEVTQSSWRTTADTRERLEILAKKLLGDRLFNKSQWAEASHRFPDTSLLFDFIESTLVPVLEQSAHDEIDALLRGFDCQFIKPGASGAPTRGRLDTLPTGRNFYSLDNRSIPSKAAWALGQKSAEALILRHLQDHGVYPRQLGLSVWGTATMRTGGDDIAQAFALMGIKPVWAIGSMRVVDFEIIPAMLLGRPRVDVTLRASGFFRDAFMNVLRLFDAAVHALAEFDEPGESNTIRQHVEDREKALTAQGMSAKVAAQQARFRAFGSKPGSYGAGLQGLIDEKCWEDRSDLTEAYINFGGFAYSRDFREGVEAKEAFSHQLSVLDTVVQNQDNREHDILDSDDYYQFQGGMTNAVTTLSGDAPSVYLNDHSNPERPRIRTLKEELNRVVRSRVLNPKWIQAMKKHHYKGAFEMAATVDYLFAYDATTDLVADYQYEAITDAFVVDSETRQFLKENNPQALREMSERLLEAIARGMWQDQTGRAGLLRELLNALEDELESA